MYISGPWLFEGLSSPLEINSLIERTVGSVTFTRGMPGFTTDIIHSSFFFTLVTESSSVISVRLWNLKDGGSQKARFLAKNQYTQR